MPSIEVQKALYAIAQALNSRAQKLHVHKGAVPQRVAINAYGRMGGSSVVTGLSLLDKFKRCDVHRSGTLGR